VLESDDSNVIALNNIAYILSDKLGNPTVAEPYARKAATLARDPAIMDTLGWALVHLGKFEDAVGELSEAVRVDPEFCIGYLHLGQAYRRMGEFDQAVRVLELAADLAKLEKNAAQRPEIEAALEKARAANSEP